MEPRRRWDRRARRRTAGLVATILLMATGCAGSGAEPTPTVAPDCADLSTEPTFTIELVDYAFHPGCAIVTTEAPFSLRNTGDAVHTFTLDGTSVDIEIGPGDDFASEDGLDVRPGVYLLRCTLHEQMFGTLEVR